MALKDINISRAKNRIADSENKNDRTEIIEISAIDFNEDNVFNVADSKETIGELAKNIKQNGLIHNIVVSRKGNGRYKLLSGERRVRAHILLGLSKIKANIVNRGDRLQEFRYMCDANTETRKYSPEGIDQIVTAIRKKVEEFAEEFPSEVANVASETIDAIERHFNVTERTAYKYIGINELVEPLKKLFYAEKIKTDTAARLSTLPENVQERVAEIYQSGDSDADEKAERFVKTAKAIIEKNKEALQKQNWAKRYATKKLLESQESGDSKMIEKQETKLQEIDKAEKKVLAKQAIEIDSISVEPMVVKEKTPEEIISDSVKKIRKSLKAISDIGVCDNTTIEEITRLLEKI